MASAICVFCGAPGAGKSTVAKYVCDVARMGYNFIHVCYDALIPSVNHVADLDTPISAWKAARLNILDNLERLMRSMEVQGDTFVPICNKDVVMNEMNSIVTKVKMCNPREPVVFVIDDNMYYRGMRHEYYKLCAKLVAGFSIIYFETPLEICHARNSKRVHSVPGHVIEKMYKQIEPPGKSERCSWEKCIAIIQAEKSLSQQDVAEKILSVVRQSLLHPASPPKTVDEKSVEETRNVNRQSFVHQGDLFLRKGISAKIQELREGGASKKEIMAAANALNVARKRHFELLKLGYVDNELFLNEDGGINLEMFERLILQLID